MGQSKAGWSDERRRDAALEEVRWELVLVKGFGWHVVWSEGEVIRFNLANRVDILTEIEETIWTDGTLGIEQIVILWVCVTVIGLNYDDGKRGEKGKV